MFKKFKLNKNKFIFSILFFSVLNQWYQSVYAVPPTPGTCTPPLHISTFLITEFSDTAIKMCCPAKHELFRANKVSDDKKGERTDPFAIRVADGGTPAAWSSNRTIEPHLKSYYTCKQIKTLVDHKYLPVHLTCPSSHPIGPSSINGLCCPTATHLDFVRVTPAPRIPTGDRHAERQASGLEEQPRNEWQCISDVR